MKGRVYLHSNDNVAIIRHRRRFAWIPTKISKKYFGEEKYRWLCFYWSHDAKSIYGIYEFARTHNFVYLNPPTEYKN